MHQEHNIAWNKLASNITFISNNPHYTPRRSDFFPKNLPSQTKDLDFFVNTITKTITVFSQFEREKYPSAEEIVEKYSRDGRAAFPTSGKLYPDELLRKYPEYLNEVNQKIEFWIDQAKVEYNLTVAYQARQYEEACDIPGIDPPSPAPPPDPFVDYSTRHGGLADVVKILIQENQLETLLTLAHHPEIPIARLHHLSWGHHFGWSRVMEACIASYVYFNVLVATGVLYRERGKDSEFDGGRSQGKGGVYKESSFYQRLLRMLTMSMDYPAQQLPHRAFFGETQEQQRKIDLARDYEKLHQYLKDIFAMLYRYDVVAKECGIDSVDWRRKIVYVVHEMCGVRTEWVFNEQTNKEELRFC
ncbi:hypothetical protein AX16_002142 [Volvariella volvacea WC 439]|nr:hypothetical protein AX16_002142 [Volvariella volvacea WC 439]